jgi:transcriptional regulator with XRE-family HTH domain
MTPQETFISRLRRHRERNQITLEEIVSETRIRRDQLEAFERGDLTVWPRGIYARAWIRGYASVVGLDPIDTVDEFCKLFPQGDRRVEGTFREFSAIIAHPSTYSDEFQPQPEGDRRQPRSRVNMISTQQKWRDNLLRIMRNLRNIRPTRTARPARPVGTMHGS